MPKKLPGDVDAGQHEHYRDAALYDHEYRRRRDDVRFYRGLADELLGGPGRILELACGSGRVTASLVRGGHTVIGLDRAAAMLSRARERLDKLGRAARQRVSLVRADMRRFALGARFSLVIMAFNSFEHLYTHDDVRACLRCVRDHLAPGGTLVFDVEIPDLRWLARDPRKRWARTRFTHPITRQRLIYSTNHDYDPISQTIVIRLYYEAQDGETRVVRLSQRKFFPAELVALLRANQFDVTRRFGDFDGEPLTASSNSQVLQCRPTSAATRAPEESFDDPVVARLGIQRDDAHLYYIKQGSVWRAPRGDNADAELLATPAIDLDEERYVYFLDADGHIARVPRLTDRE